MYHAERKLSVTASGPMYHAEKKFTASGPMYHAEKKLAVTASDPCIIQKRNSLLLLNCPKALCMYDVYQTSTF